MSTLALISAETIVKRVNRLPALSASVARLAALAGDENATVAELEGVVRPDIALTANLLRYANSAAVRGRVEVVTVRDAVLRLGRQQLWNIAASGSLAKVIPTSLPGYGFETLGFWRHSVAVAVLAQRIADAAGLELRVHAFTAGLMHDVGKLVVEEFLASSKAAVLARMGEGGMAFVASEREVLGTDHTEVGGRLAERWGLPSAVVTCCRGHHEPEALGDVPERRLACAVHVANALAHGMGLGADVGELRRKTDAGAMARLALDTPKLEVIACASLDEIERLASGFGGKA